MRGCENNDINLGFSGLCEAMLKIELLLDLE